MHPDWQSDWLQFVAHVVAMHTGGMSDAQISALLGGRQVRWEGVIATLGLERTYARGPQFDMPEMRLALIGGKVLVANFAAVCTEAADEESWRQFTPGSQVPFIATLATTIGLFPGIRVSYDDEGDEAILMVSLNHGHPAVVS